MELKIQINQEIPGIWIHGAKGPVRIEYATHLNQATTWSNLTTVPTSNSPYLFMDTTAGKAPMRFYRAASDPLSPENPDPLHLVWIRPGTYMMGTPGSQVNDGPQTQVTLSRGFWMSKYETTQEEYLALIGVNPAHFTGDLKRPVEQVSWNDATNYCALLTVRDWFVGRLPAGFVYRLPTDAEWEYACRAGTTTATAFGDSLSSTQANFWGDYPYGGAAKGPYLERTTAVGSYAPNAWGLYDMHGNVWEWASDWFSNALPGGSVTDPQGPNTGVWRIYRGGWWYGWGEYCLSASRNSDGPGETTPSLGFRPVLAPGRLDGLTVPVIVREPQTQTVRVGKTAIFGLLASGSHLFYQWRFNGVDIFGATNGNYRIGNVQAAQDGSYSVVVRNMEGSAASQAAVLTVDTYVDPEVDRLAWIKPGIFTMGGPGTETDRKDDEGPQTQVTISSGFWMSKYETTQEEYESVMGGNPSHFKGNPNLPVEMVSWDDATNYCAKLTVRVQTAGSLPAGYEYRLPTEAEWEYACRAGTTAATAYGDSLSSTQANFNGLLPYGGAGAGPYLEKTARVGTYATNAWGLYDMHGNVSEWCLDGYGAYPGGSVIDPQDPATPTSGTNRVLRGGSWNMNGGLCRSASRSYSTPESMRRTDGFRTVLAPRQYDNWGFEESTLLGWEATGDFSNWQPVVGDMLTVKRIPAVYWQMTFSIGGDYWRNLTYPVGHRGRQWLSTAVYPKKGAQGWVDDAFNDDWVGTLTSRSFVLQKQYVTFLVGGGQDDEKLRVELLVQVPDSGPNTIQIDGANYEIVNYSTGHGRESMRRAHWDMSGLTGRAARIRIVDHSVNGHLNVDDFRFQETLPSSDLVTVGGGTYPATMTFDGNEFDSDSPVWGFADLHTHPMSYLGFGGKIMHGQPDGGPGDLADMAAGLSNCKTNHGGWGLDNLQGNYWRQILMEGLDNAGPDPHSAGWTDEPSLQFRNWPAFTSISHQQMWFEWIRRARDGGLRVMVALCLNNRLLGAVSKGDLPVNDQAVGDSQITELKAFVSRHTDFMEIAYDPYQLRDIVRRGNLAVIIGSELDDIGDFARNSNVSTNADEASKRLVSAELQRLHTAGVRYIFPVHLVNNKFAGTAIAGMMLNMANKYLNGEGFQVQRATKSDNIQYWLEGMDFLSDKKAEVAGLIWCLAPGSPCFPTLLGAVPALLGTAQAIMPAIGPGAAMAGGLMPLALFGAANLPVLLTIIGVDQGDVVEKIIPLPGNYPHYFTPEEEPNGIRNALGLTPLGRYAVNEMMNLGMMIDIDHLSMEALDGTNGVLAMAANRPGGYPMNSGHNGFREQGLHERAESSRTFDQIQQIRTLGGLLGVAWGNSKDGSLTKSFKEVGPSIPRVDDPYIVSSAVANDCAGTSKTFAQTYLIAVDQLEGSHVAIGTDIDGFFVTPGPRFGPQAAFGLAAPEAALREKQINDQQNGVLYEPRYGAVLTTGAFRGRAVEPKNLTGSVTVTNGYVYNVDQADFFAAMSIFYSLRPYVEAGQIIPQTLMPNIDVYANAFSANTYGGQYPDFDTSGGSRAHIANYAAGLLAGIYDWPIGNDFTPDKTATTKIGKAVYLNKVRGSQIPPEIAGLDRYKNLLKVWDDYQKIFGTNTPLKRCQSGSKQWDINFEGVAHYGLLPDLLQDLSNVGLQSRDMSVLFRSAEDFAQMWTRSLKASFPAKTAD